MLTIIIPYYKITFFKETLLSLEQQTCKKFNLFIGDDASLESPENLIRETLKTTKFTYKRYEDNLGSKNLANQWKRCIRDSDAGEWFLILGDDDLIAYNLVEEFYRNLAEIDNNKCSVVKFSQCWINEKGYKIRDFTRYDQLISPIENWEKKYIHGHQSSLSEHIFRKSSYLKYGFRDFPLAWGSDDVAVLEFSDGKEIFFIDGAKVYVRISRENISGKTDNMKEKEAAVHQLEEYLLIKHYRKLPENYVAQKVQQHLHYAFLNKPSDLRINLLKLYWHIKDYRKILTLPKTYFHLYSQ
ncbi:MAG: glycosyltransferase [Weeksellaceae bacterium]|nr:glycosyltransferase [Bacteroidota bacterium]MCG2779524.1 glycosyltransferase [Weeksellaceae bacterium]